MHKAHLKTEHNNQQQEQQYLGGIYGYVPLKTSFLALIYQHTSMTQLTQAFKTLSQGKDWTFNVNLTQTCKYKRKDSYGWNPSCLTCVCLS